MWSDGLHGVVVVNRAVAVLVYGLGASETAVDPAGDRIGKPTLNAEGGRRPSGVGIRLRRESSRRWGRSRRCRRRLK